MRQTGSFNGKKEMKNVLPALKKMPDHLLSPTESLVWIAFCASLMNFILTDIHWVSKQTYVIYSFN
jgi:hypothetical protein